MQLSVKDRLMLLGILPQQGNILTLRIVSRLRDDLALSEGELVDFAVKEEGARITWDETKALPKDVPIGEKARDIITNALNALNANNQLRLELIPLYERFVEDKDAPAS